MNTTKFTDGSNDRPKNAPIGQTGEGLPDDSSTPVQVDESEVERVRRKLVGDGGEDEAEGHPS
ncbi:hypothetical protein [Aureimonas frigidaquae]|uniref:hypothetical protein n=1 Tax=Aureimonas frigidaquae TaxID=424757 RepID=UPI000785A335|nr:hypothetical protein [Aureimonas frigidaquae]